MPSLLVWLMAVIGPLARKVLLSLGIGWVVFSGYKLVIDQVKSQVVSYWGAMPSDVISVLSMSGFGDAFGIVLGAFAYRAAMMAAGHLGKVTS